MAWSGGREERPWRAQAWKPAFRADATWSQVGVTTQDRVDVTVQAWKQPLTTRGARKSRANELQPLTGLAGRGVGSLFGFFCDFSCNLLFYVLSLWGILQRGIRYFVRPLKNYYLLT